MLLGRAAKRKSANAAPCRIGVSRRLTAVVFFVAPELDPQNVLLPLSIYVSPIPDLVVMLEGSLDPEDRLSDEEVPDDFVDI